MTEVFKRLVQMVVTLAVLSVLLFRLLSAMPGNPVELLITSNPSVRPEDVARLKRLRGLDQPWYIQYVRWLYGYHEARQPPQYTGSSTSSAVVGAPWSSDLSKLLRDPDGGSPPRIEAVSSDVRVEGVTVFATFASPGVHTVALVATDDDGLEAPVRIDVEVRETSDRAPVRDGFRFPELGIKNDDADRPFELDLRALLTGAPEGTAFSVVRGGGEIVEGIYRNDWTKPGQSVVVVAARAPGGRATTGIFGVDHGPLPDPARFQGGFLFGNLGFSNTYKRPVSELLGGRVANTLRLMVPAFLLSLLLAIPLGVLAARRQYSWVDYALGLLAFGGISVPVFWLGIMAIIVFSVQLRMLPPGGMATPGIDDVVDQLRHLVLPVCVLSLAYTGRWLRYVRASMLEVLSQDYIRTARAKGLPESVVVWKHAFRNALIPVVTVLALSIPALFSGAVLTETVFSWPGVGRLIFESVMNSDYYVAMVAFLISASLVMLGNVLADALYVLVDPRMRRP